MALDTDDIAPPPANKPALKDLTPLSVEDLQQYIAGLEAETARARAAVAAKGAHRAAAAAFFKS
jgi:uncharacterized small protein (DUF1192 family)